MANPTVFVSALTFTLTQRIVAATTYTSITAATIDDWSSVTEGGFCKLNKGSSAEWFSFTGITIGSTSGGITNITFTGVTMGIDKDALTITSADSANRRNHASGTTVGKLVYHSQQLNKAFQIDKDNTVSGDNTFTGTNTFSSTTENTLVVQRVTTAQKLALPLVEASFVKDDTLGQASMVIGGAWQQFGVSTTPVNASETVAGIVEKATDAQVTAGTETGETGAYLFMTPKQIAVFGTAGETLTADQLVYLKSSDNKLYKATQDVTSDANSWDVVGIVVTGGAANATVLIKYLTGTVTLTTPLTANTVYYLGTAGALTATRPSMSSSTIIPLRIGKTDATGRLNCKVQRLQRRKTVLLYQSDISASPTTVTVGFPISIVHATLNTHDTGGYPWSHTAGAGYYDVLGGTQESSLRPYTSGYMVGARTGAATFYTVQGAIVSDNLSLTLSSTTLPFAGSTLIFDIYEAL